MCEKSELEVAVLELALARLRSWAHEIQPRNPHHEVQSVRAVSIPKRRK